MSSEQASGLGIDFCSDLFSFGSLLYEMITGQRAFTGDDTRAILAAILTREPVPLSRIAQRVPAEIERIVQRCLKKEPEKRFPSASDLHAALEESIELTARRAVFGWRRRPVLRSFAVTGASVLILAIALLAFRPGWLPSLPAPFDHIEI